jgi:DNA polymerase-3 subunit epsilon
MQGKQIILTRPLVTFDLETTGLNPKTDRIVEISIIKRFPGGKEKDLVKTRKLNPGRPIPPEVTAIHGISDADVKDCPFFFDIAESLAELIRGCDFVGYNSNRFDVPFLLSEFERAGIYDALDGAEFIDVFNMYQKFNPRTLSAAYSDYCGKTLNAHKAEEDAKATLEVLEAIFNAHIDELTDQTIKGLASIGKKEGAVDILGVVVNSPKGPVFSIGKHKGELVKDCAAYCDWIVNKSDFSHNTKKVITNILREDKLGIIKDKFDA